MSEKLYTVKEMQEYLGIHRTYAYKILREGKLPKIKLGKRILIRESDLQAFLDRNTIDMKESEDVQDAQL